jgi:hypothetical protein
MIGVTFHRTALLCLSMIAFVTVSLLLGTPPDSRTLYRQIERTFEPVAA